MQDGVGLYEGKFKIPDYQNGHAYLTSHRVCYVDNAEPRKYSIAVDLKEIERTEFYAGFLKSSPKITLFPKPSKRASLAIRSPVPHYPSQGNGSGVSTPRSIAQSPAPARDVNVTWICPICGFSNPVPSNFDPTTANQHTPLPPCQACGIKPPLALIVKVAIGALSNRTVGVPQSQPPQKYFTGADSLSTDGSSHALPATAAPLNICPRCTFENHPSLTTCEICGAPLQLSLIHI